MQSLPINIQKAFVMTLAAAFILVPVLILVATAGIGTTKLHAICFEIGYIITPSTDTYLKTYKSFYLDHHNAGTLNDDIDSYLTQRLETNISANELDAIANFYASNAGGREGVRIVNISETAKNRVIESLVRSLSKPDSRDTFHSLLLIEEIRSGDNLGKGYFGIKGNFFEPFDRDWWESEGEQETKTSFLTWWNSSDDWNIKRHLDPLEKSRIKAFHCCG